MTVRRRHVERSRGRALLLAVLRDRTREDVARAVGVTPRAVSHWASGRRVPLGWHERTALEKRFSIDPHAWDESSVPASNGTRVPRGEVMVQESAPDVERREERDGTSCPQVNPFGS